MGTPGEECPECPAGVSLGRERGAMFDMTIVRRRSDAGQWIAEAVAAVGLLAHMEEQLITIRFAQPDASVSRALP